MQTMERETGFHEGVRFAIEVMERQLLNFPDSPFMVLDIVKKTLLLAEDKKHHD